MNWQDRRSLIHEWTFFRAARADTLALARSIEPVPPGESAMSAWARLVDDCRQARVHRAVKLVDALIAATAIDLGLPVVTQDADVDVIASVHPPLEVLRV